MRKAAAIRFPKRPASSGFTLLELVIAIGLLSLLAGVGLEAMISVNDKTAFRVTVERMDKIREALLQYSRDTVQTRLGNNPGSGVMGIVVSDSPTKINPAPYPASHPSALRFYVPYFDPYTSSPAHSPYLPPSMSRNEPAYTDDYFDGWGSEILYLGPASGLATADQAIAYVVSMGPDRIQDFMGKGTAPGDDLVYEINCTQIFNEEAQRRVDEINAAIAKRSEDLGGQLIATSNLSAAGIAVAVGSSYGEAELLEYLMHSYPLLNLDQVLPLDDRYRYSPWNVGGTVGYDGFVLLGGFPVGQMGYVKP